MQLIGYAKEYLKCRGSSVGRAIVLYSIGGGFDSCSRLNFYYTLIM